MNAKLIAINVPSPSPETRSFYERLVGVEAAQALSSVNSAHMPMPDGMWLWLSEPQHPNDKVPVAYFAVSDVDEALRNCVAAGGRAIGEVMKLETAEDALAFYGQSLRRLGVDEPLTPLWGRAALVRDPGGNLIGLMEVEPHSHIFYNLGKYFHPVPAKILVEHGRAIAYAEARAKGQAAK
ncbi:VOC family protein [Sorangium sp. So ce1000]|uniref:VOC family protein n=1 Tax=Sorangium sp. So ce1000 TaxID=3133325 RepID=UPI003F6102C0